jgi:hypothetical protein
MNHIYIVEKYDETSAIGMFREDECDKALKFAKDLSKELNDVCVVYQVKFGSVSREDYEPIGSFVQGVEIDKKGY